MSDKNGAKQILNLITLCENHILFYSLRINNKG